MLHYIQAEKDDPCRLSAFTNFLSGTKTGGRAELWYISSAGSGYYKIEHLGRKEGDYGIYANVLTGSASSSTAKSGSVSLSKWNSKSSQMWHISKSGSNYQISNRAYPHLILTVPAKKYYNKPVLSKDPFSSDWIFFDRGRSDYWQGGYKNTPTKKKINVIVDEKAVLLRYTNSVYAIGTAWNNIDPNISITVYPSTYTGSYAEADFTITVVGYSGGTGDERAGFLNVEDIHANWTHAEIRINMFCSEAREGTLSELRSIFLHELGHGLKLAHPHDYSDYRPLAIMNQEYWTYENSYRPSGHDKYMLRKKW